ncbi:hypothetical protein [Pseudolactococcus reticulitermitis]|uniref:WxL domain-containing protein n=1 Tax=Pseudolactococcus reticulitermitis TaxID=2025039 RepID=A0A224XE74_9LACT|nr:hypothetical protein [Lactococcus reticulitermitis]GAX47883.1 hypothetical protein RsY01_1487 [Lactococcus reticulitermitis]
MKRKMLIGLGMSLAAVLLSRTADADVNTPGNGASATGTTNVTYTVPSTYTVVIPSALAITAADTYVGDTNNVFIKTSSQVGATETVKVTMPTPQTFKAVNGTSEIPLTISHQANGVGTATEVSSLASEVTLLSKTGTEIGAEDSTGETATVGVAALSATVKAKATTAQIATASFAGLHTGTIQFAVTKGT